MSALSLALSQRAHQAFADATPTRSLEAIVANVRTGKHIITVLSAQWLTRVASETR